MQTLVHFSCLVQGWSKKFCHWLYISKTKIDIYPKIKPFKKPVICHIVTKIDIYPKIKPFKKPVICHIVTKIDIYPKIKLFKKACYLSYHYRKPFFFFFFFLFLYLSSKFTICFKKRYIFSILAKLADAGTVMPR